MRRGCTSLYRMMDIFWSAGTPSILPHQSSGVMVVQAGRNPTCACWSTGGCALELRKVTMAELRRMEGRAAAGAAVLSSSQVSFRSLSEIKSVASLIRRKKIRYVHRSNWFFRFPLHQDRTVRHCFCPASCLLISNSSLHRSCNRGFTLRISGTPSTDARRPWWRLC